ncbi:unnamed protein product [Eruca vesicaria subsp. sativa]|uniref:Uncharacterized protein n=1 Tax=Eruca vesicaria subsp. sativa TaxID=29727 RepID=A0ABC8L1I5_ERUVS|nr:unnamed protein product [Eruca vesicaria subsp. sativa]
MVMRGEDQRGSLRIKKDMEPKRTMLLEENGESSSKSRSVMMPEEFVRHASEEYVSPESSIGILAASAHT